MLDVRTNGRAVNGLDEVLDLLGDLKDRPSSPLDRLRSRRTRSGVQSSALQAVGELRRQMATLTARTLAARAAYRAWALPIIAADRELTPAETTHRSGTLEEIAELDKELSDKALEVLDAITNYLAQRSAPVQVG